MTVSTFLFIYLQKRIIYANFIYCLGSAITFDLTRPFVHRQYSLITLLQIEIIIFFFEWRLRNSNGGFVYMHLLCCI